MSTQYIQYQPVKINDETLERHGQVGVYIGMDGPDCIVKFDSGTETFEPASLTGLY
jgi:hypothetical protein